METEVTPQMRTEHFDATGMYASDYDIIQWFNKEHNEKHDKNSTNNEYSTNGRSIRK